LRDCRISRNTMFSAVYSYSGWNHKFIFWIWIKRASHYCSTRNKNNVRNFGPRILCLFLNFSSHTVLRAIHLQHQVIS
jgi:hypothetical protein